MRIFVLEDDFSQQTRIETTIEKLLKAHHIIPSSFEVFGKPDQLLAEVHEKGAHQLFFLDIEIRNEEMKGLEVARKIRDRDPYALIVFVTTHSEFMPLSFRYQVSALDYIDKALSAEEFESRIETALLYANSQDSKSLAEDCFYFNVAQSPSCYSLYQDRQAGIYSEFRGGFQAGVPSLAVPPLFSHQSCKCGAFG